MSSDFVSKVLDVFGLGDDEEENYGELSNRHEEERIEVFPNVKGKKDKIVSIHSNYNAKVVVYKLGKHEDVTTLCDWLKERRIVVINLKDLELELAQRCVDFLGGAVYALNGDIQEISSGIVLITPNNVEVSSEMKEQLSSYGMFSWTYKGNK